MSVDTLIVAKKEDVDEDLDSEKQKYTPLLIAPDSIL